MKKRAIILVIDSMGIGAMADASDFGDRESCNTLANVARFNNGLQLPILQSLGLGNLLDVMGVEKVEHPLASHGIMLETSLGKDTTTGHWEMAGIVLEKPFRVFPKGFPADLMEEFVNQSACGGYLGNKPASGTEIIAEYHEQHLKLGYPIVYTSADSVFQIACDVDRVPLEKLYAWCEVARKILDTTYNCSRVIARPYRSTLNGLERISEKRKDYSVLPPKGSILDKIKGYRGRVIGIGKINDIFLGQGITHSIKTKSNKDGLIKTISAIKNEIDYAQTSLVGSNLDDAEMELIFTNLVDTDMLYGHRNDPRGYGMALEEIDLYLKTILPLIDKNDLLIITADHGCDPTEPGTDHTREMVPLLIYSPAEQPFPLGTKTSFTYVAKKVAEWLNLIPEKGWE
jgi:phosphopentomutase